MATPPVDIKKLDILQAQISVSISQARSLVDSWLPPAASTAGKSAPLYSAPPDDDSDELFKPKPPRIGLGAPIPKHFYDDDQKLRKDISSVDLLKRRLLGSKRNASQMSDKPTQHKARYQNGNSSRAESESEEEEGRSALGKPKRPKVEAEKTWEGSDVKRQKDNERKVMVGASSGPEKPDEKKDPREEGEEGRLKASQSNTAASKFQASNGGVDANEPGKKKKKKKKKSTNKQTK